jgi:hypothetical protein
VVVDDAEEPDRPEAEEPDEGEVEAPELPWALDVDAAWPATALLLESDDEVAAAEEDAADSLAGDLEAEHPLGEVAELAGAEAWQLDVEADELLLDVRGRAVPGGAARHGDGPRVPAPEQPPQRRAEPPGVTPHPAPSRLDGHGEAEQEPDDVIAPRVVDGEEALHRRKVALRRARFPGPW